MYQHLPGNLCSFPGPLLFPRPLSLQLTLLQYDVAEKEFERIISNFTPKVTVYCLKLNTWVACIRGHNKTVSLIENKNEVFPSLNTIQCNISVVQPSAKNVQ